MKFWKRCLLTAVLLFLMCAAAAEAAEPPLTVRAAYSDDGTYISVYVSAKEPVVLNAFTFSIVYDNSVYEIYQGNDQLQGGYGYNGDFQNGYQDGGMLVQNAADSKVLFSGVNNREQLNPYIGTIAEATFLKYNKQEEGAGSMVLEVSALCINGQTMVLTGDERRLVCSIEEPTGLEVGKTDEPVLASANPQDSLGRENEPADPPMPEEDSEMPLISESNKSSGGNMPPADTSGSSAEGILPSASGQSMLNDKHTDQSVILPAGTEKNTAKEKQAVKKWMLLIIVICCMCAGMLWLYRYVRKKPKYNTNNNKKE